MTCVRIVNYTILLNGESVEPFNAAKGLRQGDPISLFLFAISMEYLSRLLNELQHDNIFIYHPRCGKLHITHLSYADDPLLFARGDTSLVQRLHECFTIFSTTSGLQANLAKSAIYCGGWRARLEKQSTRHWDTLKGTTNTDCTVWNPILLGSNFPLPVKVIKVIEAYCRSYIWSGGNEITKRALIARDKVCLPKTVGGLNLTTYRYGMLLLLPKHSGIYLTSKTNCGLNGFMISTSKNSVQKPCLSQRMLAGW
ncbi:PREDICTED: uncharacterized protein LOC109231443 [Nicotiana attenuata]|uniref:uncharacterized protein LOC109231443 n=1 Tax=Nicotiana attenuata TaxID=49451 RepID=UPI000904E865|nr:PREDICTED: uncharacterized protein LOC109231443 [Nicotiana attenuata]